MSLFIISVKQGIQTVKLTCIYMYIVHVHVSFNETAFRPSITVRLKFFGATQSCNHITIDDREGYHKLVTITNDSNNT